MTRTLNTLTIEQMEASGEYSKELIDYLKAVRDGKIIAPALRKEEK